MQTRGQCCMNIRIKRAPSGPYHPLFSTHTMHQSRRIPQSFALGVGVVGHASGRWRMCAFGKHQIEGPSRYRNREGRKSFVSDHSCAVVGTTEADQVTQRRRGQWRQPQGSGMQANRGRGLSIVQPECVGYVLVGTDLPSNTCQVCLGQPCQLSVETRLRHIPRVRTSRLLARRD